MSKSNVHILSWYVQAAPEGTPATGADPGFVERGFRCVMEVCVCVGGVRFVDFISFFLNIPWKWINLVSVRPNYFIFMWFKKKTGAGERGSSEPSEPHLDPQLGKYDYNEAAITHRIGGESQRSWTHVLNTTAFPTAYSTFSIAKKMQKYLIQYLAIDNVVMFALYNHRFGTIESGCFWRSKTISI